MIKVFHVPTTQKAILHFLNKLRNVLAKAKVRDERDIILASEEVLVNILQHSGLTAHHKIQITCHIKSNRECIALTFKDSGIPYDPFQRLTFNTHLPINERPIGGLGIPLIKALIPIFSYQYVNGQNIVKLVKKFK